MEVQLRKVPREPVCLQCHRAHPDVICRTYCGTYKTPSDAEASHCDKEYLVLIAPMGYPYGPWRAYAVDPATRSTSKKSA